MSGIKPLPLTEFYRSLRARGLTLEALAESVGRSRAAVCRVINGSRRRGPVWQRIRPLLTEREVELLNHVAICPAWNNSREEKRPKWTAEKQAILNHE